VSRKHRQPSLRTATPNCLRQLILGSSQPEPASRPSRPDRSASAWLLARSAAHVITATYLTPRRSSAAKQAGQIPANYTAGSGTIVSGTAANKATEAALAAYPGGEVHYIGVNWPHHIFINQSFTVVGAD
jgi:hypothetical protein